MKLGALRNSALSLGAATIALLTPVAPANAAVRHHAMAGPAMHHSAHASYRGAWRGGYRHTYASGRHYRYAHGYRYAYGHGYAHGRRGAAVAGGYYGGYYAGGYHHHHSCWWYRRYDPYGMPSWCGTYYTPAYDYSYGSGYGPYVGLAYGSGYGGGYRYGRRYGFHGGHHDFAGQAGHFAGARMGGSAPQFRIGGANVSGMGAAHFAGGFHGRVGGPHIGGGLRIH